MAQGTHRAVATSQAFFCCMHFLTFGIFVHPSGFFSPEFLSLSTRICLHVFFSPDATHYTPKTTLEVLSFAHPPDRVSSTFRPLGLRVRFRRNWSGFVNLSPLGSDFANFFVIKLGQSPNPDIPNVFSFPFGNEKTSPNTVRGRRNRYQILSPRHWDQASPTSHPEVRASSPQDESSTLLASWRPQKNSEIPRAWRRGPKARALEREREREREAPAGRAAEGRAG